MKTYIPPAWEFVRMIPDVLLTSTPYDDSEINVDELFEKGE